MQIESIGEKENDEEEESLLENEIKSKREIANGSGDADTSTATSTAINVVVEECVAVAPNDEQMNVRRLSREASQNAMRDVLQLTIPEESEDSQTLESPNEHLNSNDMR